MRAAEEMTAGADFVYGFDAEIRGGRANRLEHLGEHLQHLDVENEFLV